MCEKKMEKKLVKQPWLWTMSSGSRHCHFEAPRSKVYVLDEEILPNPLPRGDAADEIGTRQRLQAYHRRRLDRCEG